MAKVTLESQLETYASEVPTQYETLLTTWRHNKTQCESLLSSVSEHFMYYSSHSAKHSDRVIRNIERLLGDDRIRLFSVTDIWLLLHVCYVHDLGMVIPYEEYRTVWTSSAFRTYLQDTRDSPNPNLRQAAHFLRELPEMARDAPPDWPVQFRSASAILISEFFHPNHAERIMAILAAPKDWSLTFDNIRNPRLVKLIGEIASLHTSDSQKILRNLEAETVGFGGANDYAHPRFLAELLRLGDALDLDTGRFSTDFTLTRGPLPEYSDAHRRLDASTRQLNIRPETVTYRADCPDEEVYRLAQQLAAYMREEFHFCALYWQDIAPKGFPGPAPRFDFSEQDITLNGQPDKEGLVGLRFTLSESKAFQLLEGTNIYDDKMIFVRELLQNALDASKIQLWRDIQSGRYWRKLPKDIAFRDLQPYHIPANVFEEYEIGIAVKPLSDTEAEITFSDCGTGFTVDSVKRMCQVTKSYSDPENMRELADMPAWLRPTGGFGIGLQSVFALTDRIQIDTRSEREGPLSIIIEAPRIGGGVRVSRQSDRKRRGTTVSVCLYGNATEKFDSATFQTVVSTYAKELSSDVRMKCYEYDGCFFPFFFSDEEFYSIHSLRDGAASLYQGEETDAYRYHLSEDGTEIVLWDKREASLVRLSLSRYNDTSSSAAFSFKGMSIKTPTQFYRKLEHSYLRVNFDAYGQDVHDALLLSRGELTQSATERFDKTLTNATDFYMNLLYQKLTFLLNWNGGTGRLLLKAGEEFPYNDYRMYFWLAAGSEIRWDLSRNFSWYFHFAPVAPFLTRSEEKVYYIGLDSEQNCVCGMINWEEYVQNYDSLPYLQNPRFGEHEYHTPQNLVALESLGEILRSPDFHFDKILLEDPFDISETQIVGMMYFIEYEYISERYDSKETDCYHVLIPMRRESNGVVYLNPLARKMMMKSLDSNRRYSCPVLPEYKALALNKDDVPSGIESVDCSLHIYNRNYHPWDERMILSPLACSVYMYCDYEDLSSSDFLARLSAAEDFNALVNYVTEHAAFPSSRELVEALYLQFAEEIWRAKYSETDN